ncbi:MAG: 2-amino-4-hydroxy-6-hydroxymethyldihydropteridine diphosphokinase [Candidatus Kapaibacteriota bacterium]
METVEVLLSLGSNLGKRKNNIKKAITLLEAYNILKIKKISSFYETEPVGNPDQPNFINAAIIGETTLTPEELLSACKKIEREVGRINRPRWHPREIDLDIILYDNYTIETERLQIPHPQMHRRRFVLVPANEIASHLVVPNFNKTIGEILQDCKDKSYVARTKDN